MRLRWTDEDDDMLIEGLKLYGRKVKKLVEHLNSGRDYQSISSRLQNIALKY